MLTSVADGVLVHQSEFMLSNTVVVQGVQGALLIDPGILDTELECIADDLRGLGQRVVAGFSTHPHWDHLLWHSRFGDVPRYATAHCAAVVQERIPDAAARARVTAMMPADIVGRVSLDLLGGVMGLPVGTTQVPWAGPVVRIVEHCGHAAGHAALFVEGSGVLIAGDMLSDVLVPMLDLRGPGDPVQNYQDGLRRLQDLVDRVNVVVPGHGSVGGADETSARFAQDSSYLLGLRGAEDQGDPRLEPGAHGAKFLPALHEHQRQHVGSSARSNNDVREE